MPLVVPGLTSNSGDDKNSKWMNDLLGKKIGDTTNETVRLLATNVGYSTRACALTCAVSNRPSRRLNYPSNIASSRKVTWQPQTISQIGAFRFFVHHLLTTDVRRRLNIHTSEDGTVKKVTHG